MRAITIKKKYNVGDVFNYFFMSDLHLESPAHDRDRLIKELEYAKSENADIFIGGDVFDLLLRGDSKRYTSASSKYFGIDAVINEMIPEAISVLKPYATYIKVILCGNHEASAIKFHSIDPLAYVICELNKLEGVDIAYLGYQGYIRLNYNYVKGSTTKNFDIKAHHGTGGNAEITKGMITLNRFMSAHFADLYWHGHSHSKIVDPEANMTYLNKNGNIAIKRRIGIITGAYLNVASEENTVRDGRPNPYQISYGDRMRTNQSTGGILIRHTFLGKEDLDVKIIC